MKHFLIVALLLSVLPAFSQNKAAEVPKAALPTNDNVKSTDTQINANPLNNKPTPPPVALPLQKSTLSGVVATSTPNSTAISDLKPVAISKETTKGMDAVNRDRPKTSTFTTTPPAALPVQATKIVRQIQ